jgi:enoyl reductase-like protein
MVTFWKGQRIEELTYEELLKAFVELAQDHQNALERTLSTHRFYQNLEELRQRRTSRWYGDGY